MDLFRKHPGFFIHHIEHTNCMLVARLVHGDTHGIAMARFKWARIPAVRTNILSRFFTPQPTVGEARSAPQTTASIQMLGWNKGIAFAASEAIRRRFLAENVS